MERGAQLVWAGYAAFAWGVVFAGISFYWASGGTLGADTVGGSIEQLGRARDPVLLAALWITGFLKVLGALLAVALVHPLSRTVPRRPVALLGVAATVLLTLYGGVLVSGEALTATGAIKPRDPVDWKALLWHLYVWDMSFLVWGILFGLATWHYTRAVRRR